MTFYGFHESGQFIEISLRIDLIGRQYGGETVVLIEIFYSCFVRAQLLHWDA